MVYSTPRNFALFWQNKDRSKVFKSSPSVLVWVAPVRMLAECHANVDRASETVHCFNILYSSSRPCTDWWDTLYFADVLWSMLMHVKEWGWKRQTRRGGSNVLPLQMSPFLSRSLSSPASCINPLLSPSFPSPLIQPPLYICICCTLTNTSVLTQIAECFLPEHMLHQATLKRLPDYILSEINQKCESVCICVRLMQSSSQINCLRRALTC